jgi:hypothetical protein
MILLITTAVKTSNPKHTLRFTIAYTHSFQFVCTSGFLVTDPNNVLFCSCRYRPATVSHLTHHLFRISLLIRPHSFRSPNIYISHYNPFGFSCTTFNITSFHLKGIRALRTTLSFKNYIILFWGFRPLKKLSSLQLPSLLCLFGLILLLWQASKQGNPTIVAFVVRPSKPSHPGKAPTPKGSSVILTN